MRVALVGPEIEENLALRHLAASLLDAGHEPEILAFNETRAIPRVAREILARRPGLVGFSLVAQRRFEDFRGLAARLRSRGYTGHITAGGHFASLRAAEILRDTPEFDSILLHDGEERICILAGSLPWTDGPPEMLDGIVWRDRNRAGQDPRANGEIHRRDPVRVPEVESLALPLRRRPDRTLGFARAPMVTSRGCAGACSFCSIHAWHRQIRSQRLRFRSTASVASEMTLLHRRHGVRVFVFHDDDFIHPRPDQARHRCREILERAESEIRQPFAFVIKCRPDDVDPALFAYLKSKGLARAYVGIESNSEAGVRTLNRRTTPARNERALAVLREAGIYACFNLLLFHPDTTLAELEENLDFLERHLDIPFDVARTELYAGSALETRLLQEGRARGDYRGYDYRLPDPAAEAAFQLFARLLWDRHFGGRSILHRAQELGFRANVLRRLVPDASSAELEERVQSLIRNVNGDTVRFLRAIVEAAREGAQASSSLAPSRGALSNPALEDLRREIAGSTRRRSAEWSLLSLELEWRAALGRSRLWNVSCRLRPVLATWPRLAGCATAKAAASLPLAASVLGLLSCGNDHTHVCDPPPPPIRYTRDIEPQLQLHCALPDCHSGSSPQAGLDLTTGRGSRNLVDVPSTELPRMKRVLAQADIPAAQLPDSSYLVHKLEGTQAEVGGSGERMPKGAPPETGLTETIKAWIREGSPE